METRLKIKNLKDLIEKRKKQIDIFLDAGLLSNCKTQILDWYEDISLAEKAIIDIRMNKLRKKLQ